MKNNSKNNLPKRSASKVEKKSAKLVKPKNILTCLVAFIAVFLLLLLRIGFWQFIQGAELKESANRQQTADRTISAKRGNIYDATGKLLAASAKVDTVSVNPSYIKEENKEAVAKALSTIFQLDYEEVLKQVKSERESETIIKKVEQDKIDELKAWMKDSKLSSGISIDDDVKRYYPYGNLASNLIGFCNTDNVRTRRS